MKTKKLLQIMDSIEKTIMPKYKWIRLRYLLEQDKKIKKSKAVRFFCETCQKCQPIFIEPLHKDNLNGESIWGDIICRRCSYVIATIEANEPGTYEFTKKE